MSEEQKIDGIHRKMSPKGKGFWLARFKGNEKVFYDGPYGTSVAAKNAAEKWFNTVSVQSGAVSPEKIESLFKWLDANEQRLGVELTDELRDLVTETFLT